MPKDTPHNYHTVSTRNRGIQEAVPIKKLGCADLTKKLRELVDQVTDPFYRDENPSGWGRAYGLLLTLLQTQNLSKKHIRHNLGEKRWELMQKIIENVKGEIKSSELSKNKKKSEGASPLG